MDKTRISLAWQLLAEHCHRNSDLKINDQFAINAGRFSEFSLKAAGIFLDYSKNRVTKETMQLLFNLAEVAEVLPRCYEMFSGKEINVTEKRAVLHPTLRNIQRKNGATAEENLVKNELERIAVCVHDIHSGKWSGYSGKAITDVVNIGIGGSDLGPAMAAAALQPYTSHIKAHFVSNVDATHISETIKYLNPETTIFIVSSKTFATQETLTNAITAREWLLNKATSAANAVRQHFIGVTANTQRAVEFGIDPANIFPIWDWVGGRFSLWSAIGLSLALTIGMENFYEFLAGAHAMDEHFKTAPLKENMPVILALINIWNVNFLEFTTRAVIPYDQYLNLLPLYLQQLEMESNGKRVRLDGSSINYKTAPVVWGGVGTNSQHSFHQLLMQGTHEVPVDFIVSLQSHNPIGNHHLLLYANCLAQSRVLMCGYDESAVIAELKSKNMSQEMAQELAPHKVIPGNIPSNTLVLNKLEPATLGAVLALYEHKVFVEGIVWQINSFDQWGVEFGKHMANKLVPMLQGESELSGLDSSTLGLIKMKRAID